MMLIIDETDIIVKIIFFRMGCHSSNKKSQFIRFTKIPNNSIIQNEMLLLIFFLCLKIIWIMIRKLPIAAGIQGVNLKTPNWRK